MTPLIDWKDSFALGIAEVDAEHRELVALINELHAALGRRAGDDEIKRFLANVHEHIADHFATEERIMQQSGYGEFEQHRADHTRLLDEIRAMIANYAEAYALAPDLLGIAIEDWFMVHFRTFDARFHGAARSTPAPDAP